MCTISFKLISFLLFYLFRGALSVWAPGCGIARLPGDRIVNGQDIGYVKYPWFVGLLISNNTRALTCGASLISERHVLTAAHCYRPYFQSAGKNGRRLEDVYTIALGLNNICKNDDEIQTFTAIKVHIHQGYYNGTRYFDIALITINKPATDFTPICLPDYINDDDLIGQMATIVGLGKEATAALRIPCSVKEAQVPIQADMACLNMLAKNMHKKSAIANDIFCAGYPEGGTDTCQGDSGGPLQIFNITTKHWVLIGLTSFGFGCGLPNKFGVYTDVSHFLKWIKEKIFEDESVNYVYPVESNVVELDSKITAKAPRSRGKHLNRSINRRFVTKILQD